MDTKLTKSQQCTLVARKANSIPGCVSKKEEGILSLYAAVVRPQLGCYIHFWPLQYKKDVDTLEPVYQRATKMLEHMMYGGEAERAGYVQPNGGKVKGRPAVCKY